MRLLSKTWPAFAPLLFLSISNVFMTFAWYGQLRFPGSPLWIVVLAMQEIITLIVFSVFSVPYLNEAIRWNHMAAFCCLVLAGYLALTKW